MVFQSNLDISIPTLEFILKKVKLSWSDVQWAYVRGLLSSTDIVALAHAHISNKIADELKQELASLCVEDRPKFDAVLGKLARLDTSPDRESEEKWLFLCVAWAYQEREESRDPLGDIERIFAIFHQPADLYSFVRFMPPTDGYRPTEHSFAENHLRLMNKWKNYVSEKELRFRSQ